MDRDIHIMIAKTARNRVYWSALRMVHENIHNYYERIPLRSENILKENFDDLCAIVEALAAGKPEMAKSLVQDHIRRFHVLMMKEKKRRDQYMVE